jgi:hypothetical protein
MTTPRAWINTLAFSDGTSLTLDKSDIVLLVGPNNAGKSAALRAVRDKLRQPANASPVVSAVAVSREGEPDDLLAWIASFAWKHESSPADPIYQALGVGIHISHARNLWQSSGPSLGDLSRFFCHLVTADERLQAANPAQNIAVVREAPTNPIHYLLRDDGLETKLSGQFKKAFGVDLVVHRNAGSQIPLHTGHRPVPAPGQDRVSIDYIRQIELLPPLQTQGDGMRSFAGVLLYTSVGRESILLIDEPEAFLHPPQARQLGRMLVADKPVERQLFVATHSGDILRGVLDAQSEQVRVVRIRRHGDVNVVKQLDNAKIAELWNDPLLRYSNILDGMFHEKVIIGESDSDARFYAAMFDAVIEAKGPDTRRPDVMFTHCGGKDRLAVVIRALREVDVPIVAVTDFDVLSNERPLRDIVEATGGNWDSIQQDWSQVKSAIDTKKPELSASEVAKEIHEIVGRVKDPIFPDAAKKDIQKIFRRSTPWATAKTVGKAFVPPGQPTQAYDRLVANLKQIGIYVVEGGELESFARSVGNHGPRWVNEVLKKDLKTDTELESARLFVTTFMA